MKASKPAFFAVILGSLIVSSGCTAALWDKDTFAQHYRPANPSNLQLTYSEARHDLLVHYDELNDADGKIRRRCYWLEPNNLHINQERKPHFVAAVSGPNMVSVPVTNMAPATQTSEAIRLYAVALPDDDFFTLYSGTNQLDPYKLPTYQGSSATIKKVFLTPFAVVVDATIIGAIIGYYSAPGFFAGMSR